MDAINILGEYTIIKDECMNNSCKCGSGKPWFPLYDARGIYCQSVCKACEKATMSKYRAEIFTDPNYDCDENLNDY